MDTFLRSPVTGKRLVAKVWPGHPVFPDWFYPNSTEYWSLMFNEFSKTVPFDGLWVDMNEPSSFCQGKCDDFDISKKSFIYEKVELPFHPSNRDPSRNTIFLETKHYDGSTEFSGHSLFGYSNSKATYEYLSKRGQALPFVLSRATFPGSGKFSAPWMGDNESSFYSMKLPVVRIMNINVRKIKKKKKSLKNV